MRTRRSSRDHRHLPQDPHPEVCGGRTSINCLDITIHPAHGRLNRLTTSLFDKRTVPPVCMLHIIRFPHITSHISELAKYGIIVSQFHRFHSITLRRSNFLQSVADVVCAMMHKAYDVSRMVALVKRQCRKHTELYGTLPRHIIQQFECVLHSRLQR